jgi:hypothetical protein
MVDYTSFSGVKSFKASPKNESAVKETLSGCWWMIDKEEDASTALLATASALKDQLRPRNTLNLIHARLYGNFDMAGFEATQYNSSTTSPFGTTPSKLSLNVIASCVDTLAAKICKNKPRPMFVTSGASWPMQQKAKQLNKFGNALFHETKIHEHSTHATMDQYIFGTGALECYFDDSDRVAFKRAFIDEFLVDDADGLEGRPRQLIRRKVINRNVLLAMYPDKADLVMDAKAGPNDKPIRGNIDVVEVFEAWYLPSKKGAKDGRHMISVSSGCLFDEQWKLDCFPFVFTRYRMRPRGFWGQGIAEILTGIQVALNRTFRSIDEQIRRKGKGRIFYPINSVDPALLDNSIQSHVPYKGSQPPIQDSSPAVSQDELAHVMNLRQMAYQEVGISELSAASKKPAGLDAAVALREFNDIETERFILAGKQHEQMHMDAMELALEMIRSNNGKGYKVRLPNKRYIIEIDWKDIGLERDEYALQMFPVSSLPGTPAARLQRVEELRAGGYIDMPTAKRLLDFPDIDAEMNLANSAADDVDACISMILDDAEPKMPPIEVYQSLDMIIERATTSYLFAKHHDCEEERLSMLRQYIDMATDAKIKTIAPPPPPMAAPGAEMAPGGGGGASAMNTTNVNIPLQPTVPPIVG